MSDHVLQETLLPCKHLATNFTIPFERRRWFYRTGMLDFVIDPFCNRFECKIARTTFFRFVYHD